MSKKKKTIIILLCIIIVLCVCLYIFYLNKREITITFISDNNVVREIKVDKGEVIPLLPLEKDGYIFDGWYDKDNNLGKSRWFIKDTTVTAKWSIKPPDMTISFNTDGGNSIDDLVIECNVSLDLPKPTKKGYKFISWLNPNNEEVNDTTNLSCEDITLIAKWEKINIPNNYISYDFETVLSRLEINKSFTEYAPNEDAVNIYLFYRSSCIHCHNFLEFMNSITPEYGKYFKMVAYEVDNNQDNNNLMDEVASTLDKKAIGVPYIVIGNKVFRGYTDLYANDIKTAIMDLYETSINDRYDVMIDMYIND